LTLDGTHGTERRKEWRRKEMKRYFNGSNFKVIGRRNVLKGTLGK
jgi:hypothetical protein